ncbi:hypothetical protein D3C84_531070 [compost metagenome]
MLTLAATGNGANARGRHRRVVADEQGRVHRLGGSSADARPVVVLELLRRVEALQVDPAQAGNGADAQFFLRHLQGEHQPRLTAAHGVVLGDLQGQGGLAAAGQAGDHRNLLRPDASQQVIQVDQASVRPLRQTVVQAVVESVGHLQDHFGQPLELRPLIVQVAQVGHGLLGAGYDLRHRAVLGGQVLDGPSRGNHVAQH